MKTGRYNVGVGLLVMAGFMVYGFILIYLRDFAPDKEAWVASYSVGKHFEARLAHVHGNLFALLNLALGFVLVRLSSASDRARTSAGWLGLTGLLMPAGILGEVYLGLSPIFVLLGAVSMTASVVLTGVLTLKHWKRTSASTSSLHPPSCGPVCAPTEVGRPRDGRPGKGWV